MKPRTLTSSAIPCLAGGLTPFVLRFILAKRASSSWMQANYVHSTRPVLRYMNRTFSRASCVRRGSAPGKNPKTYSDTLLLPQTSLPMRHDAAVIERVFANKTGPQLYRWQVGDFQKGCILNAHWEPLVGTLGWTFIRPSRWSPVRKRTTAYG